MTNKTRTGYFLQTAVIFVGLPLLMWSMGDAPTETKLKETIFLSVLASFSLMLGLMFLTARNLRAGRQFTASTVIKLHKWTGYVVVAIILSHPFLLVVPRYFEAGVDPLDAFVEIITSFRSAGVLLGLVAWGLLLILATTCLLRNWLPLKYATWRTWHGALAITIIILGAWHAIAFGHHVRHAMSVYVAALAGSGVVQLLQDYLKAQTITKGQTP